MKLIFEDDYPYEVVKKLGENNVFKVRSSVDQKFYIAKSRIIDYELDEESLK